MLIEEALMTYITSLAGTLTDKVTPVETIVVVIDGSSHEKCQIFKGGVWKPKRNRFMYGEADLKLQAW